MIITKELVRDLKLDSEFFEFLVDRELNTMPGAAKAYTSDPSDFISVLFVTESAWVNNVDPMSLGKEIHHMLIRTRELGNGDTIDDIAEVLHLYTVISEKYPDTIHLVPLFDDIGNVESLSSFYGKRSRVLPNLTYNDIDYNRELINRKDIMRNLLYMDLMNTMTGMMNSGLPFTSECLIDSISHLRLTNAQVSDESVQLIASSDERYPHAVDDSTIFWMFVTKEETLQKLDPVSFIPMDLKDFRGLEEFYLNDGLNNLDTRIWYVPNDKFKYVFIVPGNIEAIKTNMFPFELLKESVNPFATKFKNSFEEHIKEGFM